MKLCILLFSAAALVLAAACSKQEPVAPAAAPAQTPAGAVESDVTKAAELVQSQTTAAERTLQNAATDLQTQAGTIQRAAQNTAADAQAQAAVLTSRVQESFESVRKLLAEKNWREALKALNDLAGTQLTPEQKGTLESLKLQAQKLAQDAAKPAEQATKALGDLLPK